MESVATLARRPGGTKRITVPRSHVDGRAGGPAGGHPRWPVAPVRPCTWPSAPEQAAQRVQPGHQAAVTALIADPGVEGAIGLQVGAAGRAGRGPRGQVREGPHHPFGGHVGQAETAQARRVDQPAAPGQRQRHRRRGRVTAPPGHRADRADGPVRPRDQRVDHGGLAHPGMPDQHADPAGQRVAERVELGAGQRLAEHHVGDAERAVRVEQEGGRREVGLGQDEQRGQARVVGGDQETVDQPRPGRRIGEGGDDHQLVRVGHDDPFHRVGVVGGTAQDGRARLDPHHPGEGARLAGDVPGQRDPVAHHHAAAAEFAGPHRGHRAVPDQSPVTAAVHRRHEGLGRVLVGGPAPGPWPGALRGPDPDVVLVQVGVGRLPVQGARSSIAAHAEVKPGNVLPTVATFSTCRPGTTRPSTAAAITRR